MEDRSADELLELVVGVITSALTAHQFEEIDEQIEKGEEYFKMLMENATLTDLVHLCYLLADFSASAVEALAESYSTDPHSMMAHLAQQVRFK